MSLDNYCCLFKFFLQVFQWINELSNPDTRETALMELSKKRESVPDLAPMLWHSFGTIVALLQEIINIYPSINPPTLTAHQSNRVCNALALLQCVASHPETRSVFLNAQIPLFLYPFLNTTSKTRPFEYLRLTSLGVIGALVKVIFCQKYVTIIVYFRNHQPFIENSKFISNTLQMNFYSSSCHSNWKIIAIFYIFRLTKKKWSHFCWAPKLFHYACGLWNPGQS